MTTPLDAGELWRPELQNSETGQRCVHPVSVFLPGIWHMTHGTALPGVLMMVNLLFPRTHSWPWALTSPEEALWTSRINEAQLWPKDSDFSNYGDHTLPLHTQMYKSNSVTFSKQTSPGGWGKGKHRKWLHRELLDTDNVICLTWKLIT